MFSITRLPRAQKICLFFIALGVALRFWGLSSAPRHYDIDESLILHWAREFWRGPGWPLYAPESTRWEMLPGYLAYGFGNFIFNGVFRAWPALLGLLEMATVFSLLKRWQDEDSAWIGAMLMALCPWHFYYSRIVGTCVGVSCLALFTFSESESPRPRAWLLTLLASVGLLYYATYRLVFSWAAALALRRRRWSWIAASLASLGLIALLLMASQTPLADFFWRGTYNFQKADLPIARHYFFSFLLPFIPLGSAYRQTGPTFIADYVHQALAVSLGHTPPLGYATAILSLGGIAMTLRQEGWRKLPLTVLFPFLTMLAIGFMGPSLSRVLILVPFLVMSAATFLNRTTQRYPRQKNFLLVLLGLISLTDCTRVLANLGHADRMQPYFHSRFAVIDDWILRQASAAEPVIVFADVGYESARFGADISRASYLALPPMSPAVASEDFFRSRSDTAKTWLVVVDEVPEGAIVLPGNEEHRELHELRRYWSEHPRLMAHGLVPNSGGGQWFRVRSP